MVLKKPKRKQRPFVGVVLQVINRFVTARMINKILRVKKSASTQNVKALWIYRDTLRGKFKPYLIYDGNL